MVKESKEVLVGINELAIVLIMALKDGAQASDAVKILDELKNNAELKEKLEAAVANIKAVPEELKEISIVEGAELCIVQLGYLPKILEALKKV